MVGARHMKRGEPRLTQQLNSPFLKPHSTRPFPSPPSFTSRVGAIYQSKRRGLTSLSAWIAKPRNSNLEDSRIQPSPTHSLRYARFNMKSGHDFAHMPNELSLALRSTPPANVIRVSHPSLRSFDFAIPKTAKQEEWQWRRR